MSQYYNPRKTRGLFEPNSREPFVLSRTGIDLYKNCPRCFYLEKRLGTGRPPGYPFSLNSAVDALLKKEFDIHRANGVAHPLMKAYGIDAVPFSHAELDGWRDSLRRGVQYLYAPANFLVRGGIDDVWINGQGELHVVDYKATAKNGEVNLDADWQEGYKRQMEVYQWLFRRNGFKVSKTGYFVYCNGRGDKDAFDGKLEFDVKIIPYVGEDAWVEQTLLNIKKCLLADSIPEPDANCDYCKFFNAREELENKAALKAAAPKRAKKSPHGLFEPA